METFWRGEKKNDEAKNSLFSLLKTLSFQLTSDSKLVFVWVLKRFEAMLWSCSKRGKELSISKIYVSIWDSTFSSRTTSKILEESESKKFDPKPAIKILNENVRSNRDRNRRRHQKKESKRQQNNLHFWNKILNENSVAKNLRSPRFNLGVTLFIWLAHNVHWTPSIWKHSFLMKI